jgi:glycosyltransferase involved in cell wall biosynthesis
MIYDRLKSGPFRIKNLFYFLVDKIAMLFADKIILETNDHIQHCSKKYNIPIKKFQRIFLTVDDSVICPRKIEKNNSNFLVHFHGEFAPFHGVKYIIQAAKMLENENIYFQIIGKGITYEEDRKLADDFMINNIKFIDRVQYNELGDYMSNADICLGIFGDNIRTLQELTNKAIEALAVKRPLITTKNNSITELLDGEDGAVLIDPHNPDEIADNIMKLKNDENKRNQIAEKGYKIFEDNCSFSVFSEKINQVVHATINCNT